ncbi:MAG: NADH-quinone oxidoreductase subunit N [Chthonomonadales bacterium]|nr:NADH-quinone oxidoreductase subunit N [Chthonomonadales bacterium]
MTGQAAIALLPLLVLAGAVVLVLLAIGLHRSHVLTASLTLAGLTASFAMLPVSAGARARQVTPLFVLDGFALLYIGLILAAALLVAALSWTYLERQAGQREEFYVLLLLATLGSAGLAASAHLASFFLSLEVLSVSLYALIAFPRASRRSAEAGLKYLVLAAASAAFLLFGMALVYAAAGTMEIAALASAVGRAAGPDALLLLTGIGMLVIGIGYKLAVAPFHLWIPDVYEGAPAPTGAFVATVSKGSVFAVLLRLYMGIGIHEGHGALFTVFAILAVASMVMGNLLALLQDNVKRILAYSSVAHLGYLLVAPLAGGALAITAATFYLAAYFVTMLGAFGVIAVLSDGERDADRMEDLRGLFARRPWLAVVLTGMLLSLAGIPLTAGFIGKFYLVASGAGVALWWLILVLVVTSVIGLFYYLRIVVAVYSDPEQALDARPPAPAMAMPGAIALAALALLLVWLGVYPSPLIALIRSCIGV